MLLSLDVGFRAMGYVLIDKSEIMDLGLWTTKKTTKKTTRVSDDHAEQSKFLAICLDDYIYKKKIEGIIGELPSGGAQSAKAIKFMGSAISIVASVAALNDLPTEWCSPGDVKKSVTGRSSASKEEIMNAICKLLNWNITKTKRSIYYETSHGKFVKKDFEPFSEKFTKRISKLKLNARNVFK